MEPQSGEQGEKTKCPGGLDRALDGDGSWQSRPGPRAQGLSLRPPGSHTCSHSRPPGGPAPGSPSSSPGLLWLRSIGAQLSPQREPQHPRPPASLPSPEETALLIVWPARHPGGSEAQKQRWEPGESCQAGLGVAQRVPEQPDPSRDSPRLMGPVPWSWGSKAWAWAGVGFTRGRGLRPQT